MLAQQKKKPAVVYQDVHQLYILHKCITSHEMWKLNYRESYDENEIPLYITDEQSK